MNALELVEALKTKLRAITWPDGNQASLFGTVVASQLPPPAALARCPLPLALVRVGGAGSDPQEPRLLTQQIEIVLVVAGGLDDLREQALTGGARADGAGGSAGRGLLEVEPLFLDAVAKLDGSDGIRLVLRNQGNAVAAEDPTHGYVVTRAFTFQARVQVEASYPPPTAFTAADQGGGDVDLAWTLPTSRSYRYQVVLRRASGSTPPASATAGTGVTLGGNLATSVTDSPGAGTWSYSLFMGYDEENASPSASTVYSSVVQLAGVVVT